jgi:Family of unknown function (DUF6610)
MGPTDKPAGPQISSFWHAYRETWHSKRYAKQGESCIMGVARIICHSKRALNIAARHGWLCGARYTNLRDVRQEDELSFLDIDWRRYSFTRHLQAAKERKPKITVARDIESLELLQEILDQAEELSQHVQQVIVVPKDPSMADGLSELIPEKFVLGFSVPTRYGETAIPAHCFGLRKVHLLGGRPDTQRRLANDLDVISLDTNRFTLDAAYGDYFDGESFKPHPSGGYDTCLEASLININRLWSTYHGPIRDTVEVQDGGS